MRKCDSCWLTVIKISLLISIHLFWNTTKAVVEFPDDATFSERVDQSHLTHKKHVKVQPTSDIAIAKFVDRVLGTPSCSECIRIFPEAGIHEDDHRQAGLHLGYEFIVPLPRLKDLPREKDRKIPLRSWKSQSASDLESPEKLGLTPVESEHKAKTSVQEDVFLRGQRKLAAARDTCFIEEVHYSTLKL